jgi:hypothetical protein
MFGHHFVDSIQISGSGIETDMNAECLHEADPDSSPTRVRFRSLRLIYYGSIIMEAGVHPGMLQSHERVCT